MILKKAIIFRKFVLTTSGRSFILPSPACCWPARRTDWEFPIKHERPVPKFSERLHVASTLQGWRRDANQVGRPPLAVEGSTPSQSAAGLLPAPLERGSSRPPPPSVAPSVHVGVAGISETLASEAGAATRYRATHGWRADLQRAVRSGRARDGQCWFDSNQRHH